MMHEKSGVVKISEEDKKGSLVKNLASFIEDQYRHITFTHSESTVSIPFNSSPGTRCSPLRALSKPIRIEMTDCKNFLGVLYSDNQIISDKIFKK